MSEYLPLTNTTGEQRSHLEAQQRSAGLRVETPQRSVGLRVGDVTKYWQGWITHPLTGQDALVINGDADKEYLSPAELSALLSEAQAESADWLLSFEPEVV